jgi:Uma2 family endonuclease
MRTLLPDPPPAEFEKLLERRRRAGADRHDEVWEGVLHMAPAPHGRHADVQGQLIEILGPPARARGLRRVDAFNLGEPDDYRVPDGGLLDPAPSALYHTTARLVVEVLSPGDETWDKLPFYAAHGVDEVLVVDPDERTINWLGREGGEYRPVERSSLIDLGVAELAEQIDWPV